MHPPGLPRVLHVRCQTPQFLRRMLLARHLQWRAHHSVSGPNSSLRIAPRSRCQSTLPTRRESFFWRAGISTLAANEDRLHRGLHGVIDAARAGAFEKAERAVMRVEHHLLRLARRGAHEKHPAVAQPDMCHLLRPRRAVDQHDFMAPVELIGFAGGKTQRNEGTDRGRCVVALPDPGIAPNSIVAAFVAETAERLEDPDQRQPFAARLGLVRRQHLIQPLSPWAAPWRRLLAALVTELRRFRTQHLTNDFP